jgi:hypothetical protein
MGFTAHSFQRGSGGRRGTGLVLADGNPFRAELRQAGVDTDPSCEGSTMADARIEYA